MRYCLFVWMLTFVATGSLSAQTELDSSQIKSFANIMHWTVSAIFGPDDGVYSTGAHQKKPWDDKPEYSPSTAAKHARFAVENAEVSVLSTGQPAGCSLEISSLFPAKIDAGPFVTDLAITGAELRDSLNNPLQNKGLNVMYATNYTPPGEEKKAQRFTASTSFKPDPVGRIRGTIDFQVRSFLKYAHAGVSAREVGKIINLGGVSLTVIGFDDEYIIVSFNAPDFDPMLLHYNAGGELLRRQSEYFGGDEATLPDFIYDVVNGNRAITEDELAEVVFQNSKEIGWNTTGKRYKVFRRYAGAERFEVYAVILSEPATKTISVE